MLPWFPGDFLKSTRGWPLIARAVYRELLDIQWDMGQIPMSPEELQGLIGARDDQWAEAWPYVAPKFPVCRARCRRNVRLEIHRCKVLTKIGAHRKGADITNKKRYGEGGRLASAQRVAKRVAERVASRARVPIPIPIPIQEPVFNLTADSDVSAPKSATSAARAGELDLIRAIYPKRAGSQRWQDAERAINARRIEGATWDELIAGVKRYAAYCAESGKLQTELVQQAATFFGKNRGYAEPWNASLTKSETRVEKNITASQEWLANRRAARA